MKFTGLNLIKIIRLINMPLRVSVMKVGKLSYFLINSRK